MCNKPNTYTMFNFKYVKSPLLWIAPPSVQYHMKKQNLKSVYSSIVSAGDKREVISSNTSPHAHTILLL